MRWLIICLLMLGCAGNGDGGPNGSGGDNGNGDSETPITITPEGGTYSVDGVEIVIPPNLVDSGSVEILVKVGGALPSPLPEEVEAAGPMVEISSDGDLEFADPIEVKVPLVALNYDDEVPSFVEWDEEASSYVPKGTELSPDEDMASFRVMYLSLVKVLPQYIPGLKKRLLAGDRTLKVRPSPPFTRNGGFFHPNFCTYSWRTQYGLCVAMAHYATWHHRYRTKWNPREPPLMDLYRDVDRYPVNRRDHWDDDSTVRELVQHVSKCTRGKEGIIQTYLDHGVVRDHGVAAAMLIQSMRTAGPTVLYTFHQKNGCTKYPIDRNACVYHALVVYEYKDNRFIAYDSETPDRPMVLPVQVKSDGLSIYEPGYPKPPFAVGLQGKSDVVNNKRCFRNARKMLKDHNGSWPPERGFFLRARLESASFKNSRLPEPPPLEVVGDYVAFEEDIPNPSFGGVLEVVLRTDADAKYRESAVGAILMELSHPNADPILVRHISAKGEPLPCNTCSATMESNGDVKVRIPTSNLEDGRVFWVELDDGPPHDSCHAGFGSFMVRAKKLLEIVPGEDFILLRDGIKDLGTRCPDCTNAVTWSSETPGVVSLTDLGGGSVSVAAEGPGTTIVFARSPYLGGELEDFLTVTVPAAYHLTWSGRLSGSHTRTGQTPTVSFTHRVDTESSFRGTAKIDYHGNVQSFSVDGFSDHYYDYKDQFLQCAARSQFRTTDLTRSITDEGKEWLQTWLSEPLILVDTGADGRAYIEDPFGTDWLFQIHGHAIHNYRIWGYKGCYDDYIDQTVVTEIPDIVIQIMYIPPGNLVPDDSIGLSYSKSVSGPFQWGTTPVFSGTQTWDVSVLLETP